MFPAVLERLRGLLVGGPKNLLDPRIHHTLALIAFFAWVGLGSDGLSSSCYGPEEAFVHLGEHRHLAFYLVIAIVATVFLISASYSYIIELFPSGGGGYLVATKLLGPVPGVVSGGALVVDYVLTIVTSVASGCDAIFSFLPHVWLPIKLPAEFLVVALLTAMNVRGVKESILVLTPIFASFMILHIVLIGIGIFGHAPAFSQLTTDTLRDTNAAVSELGLFGVLVIFMRAFSLGGASFTGIEAVSNSTEILRDPKVETGKRTMLYMAISLSFTAGGILVCYLLNDVHHQPGRTLNASLWDIVTHGWNVGGLEIGRPVVWATLISEGRAAVRRRADGLPRGSAHPRRHGGGRLGAQALQPPVRAARHAERRHHDGHRRRAHAALHGGSVKLLLVMYSINVFLTFTLTQLGMVRHWLDVRGQFVHWKRRFFVAAIGTIVTGGILVVTTVIKFEEGGWVTLVATGAFVGFCFVVRRHYRRVRTLMSSLDEALTNLPLPEPKVQPELAPDGPTAIVMVESYAGLGIHTLLSVQRLFPRHFKNFVFVSVGLVDSAKFKGVQDVEKFEAQVREDLERYTSLAQRMGYYAEYRYTLGTDLIESSSTSVST
jgi:amino acid transporter